MLNLVQFGASAADGDARADVSADDVRRGSSCATNGVGARGPKDSDTFKLIGDRRSSRGIEPDDVPLDLVSIGAAVGNRDALEHVTRNHVAPTCARSTADGIVLRAAKNLDALVSIRNRRECPYDSCR